jgi:hypothetical protein
MSLSLSLFARERFGAKVILLSLAGRLLYHENKWLAGVLIKFSTLEYKMSCLKYALKCRSLLLVLVSGGYFCVSRSAVFYNKCDFFVRNFTSYILILFLTGLGLLII